MKRKPWTGVEDRKLARLYATLSAAECAGAMGRTVSSVQQRVSVLGLSKSPEWVAARTRQRWAEGRHEASRAKQFKRGQQAWNRGLRGVVGVQEGCRATQFKPGRPAHEARNYLPIGSLRVTKDGYLERKVTDDHPVPARRWVAEHRLVWEAANGPVPPGHLVVFKPGCRTTEVEQITPDRLECVTRAENCRRNSFWNNYPPEVARLVQLRGALNRKINNRSKQREEQGQ